MDIRRRFFAMIVLVIGTSYLETDRTGPDIALRSLVRPRWEVILLSAAFD